MTSNEHPPVYVLIGGASRRFGTSKASHVVEGSPWALHVGAKLADPKAEIVAVGKHPVEGLGAARFVEDTPGVAGPLAGVVAAIDDRLSRRGPGALVIASCDLVRPESDWLLPLHAALVADPTIGVAAYRLDDRWQPFPMVAHTRWRDALAASIAAGRRSFQSVLNNTPACAVPWSGPPGGPPQANTPEALASLLATSGQPD